MINVTINGDQHAIDKVLCLNDLLASFDIDGDKVAIEHNLEIVPKSTFDQIMIGDGDTLEIVHFIGGG
ncbi:MAG: sulfur carrier protein ThiS [Kordiimonadaceae bacterium]|jgi:thiamine biosynthesis protein ThiS|nr:sulfur carrier protein ThiS [Kordiimonadaceae bacterium]MBT6328625.1 sulfur carrier protein ThiS [Kordiimonadaceae bacterium]MBT7581875.1 sulfur carrier protein ThiS [Kordiimonadaceae bacterium]